MEHRPVSKHISVKGFKRPDISSQALLIDVNEYSYKLYECYKEFSEKYSGIILRTYEDFKIKCEEILSTKGSCIACFNKGHIEAYCFCFVDKNLFLSEEFVYLTEEAFQQMIAYVNQYKNVKIKLPSDADFKYIREYEVETGVSACILDIPYMLSKTKLSKYAIKVIDRLIEENNGIFLLNGERTDIEPSMEIEAAFLAQWFFGYKSMSDLVKEKNARLLKQEEILVYMDRNSHKTCYCIDEY